jgi:Zn-dependent M28 family amino/carboxypeptidase
MFICFAGEEVGLLGSEYYTEHPFFELNKIKFLLNLDLLGTGDEGMMVVNGSVFENEWNKLDSINSALKLLPKIGKRGKAHNSDHYYFTEKGVPSFFCYTLGGRTAYHDIYDVAEGLPLTKYKETFILLKTFLDSFN